MRTTTFRHTSKVPISCSRYVTSRGSVVTGKFMAPFRGAYSLGINAAFSSVWHMPYTPDFGHYGCDNCNSGRIDIRSRIETYKDGLNILGFDHDCDGSYFPQSWGYEYISPDLLPGLHTHLFHVLTVSHDYKQCHHHRRNSKGPNRYYVS